MCICCRVCSDLGPRFSPSVAESRLPVLENMENDVSIDVTTSTSSATTTIVVTMEYIKKDLASAVEGLSDKNYEQSLDFYRLWFDIGRAHVNIQPTQTLDDIWGGRGSSAVNPRGGQLFHPTAHLILRFTGDLESDPVLGPLSDGLQSRLCARLLESFFGQVMMGAYQRRGNTKISPYTSTWCDAEIYETERCVATDSNLIALWANLGYVEETVIRNRILQSLISFPKLYDHQADSMIILFKIAGATFEAYADPSVVDRCFELLKNHYSPDSVKGRLVQVSVLHTVGIAVKLTRI